MNKIFSIGFLILYANINLSLAQTVDLTSVDEFFKVTSTLKLGKEISEKQWNDFDISSGYKGFAESENKFIINTIKTSINIVFGNGKKSEKESILSISNVDMLNNKTLLLKKLILTNYLEINKNYDSIKSFRKNYDFNALIEKAKQKLSSFLGTPIDSTTEFKPVYFLFINADGKDADNAIYIDFTLIYKMTEEQRMNFLAHEFFHNYRRKYENHDFNYKSDLNFIIDMIQNEGIADQIDKTEGFVNYYNNVMKSPELAKIMMNLYNQAEEDLEIFQNIIVKYSKSKISEKETIDQILEVYKFNGHHIGYYMSNQIVKAGYKNEMIITFYNPYEFYSLYNKAAKGQNIFRLNDEFMNYLEDITREYYR